MQTFFALLLVFLSAVSYFVLALGFGVRQNMPIMHIVVGLMACAWLARLLLQAQSRGRRIARSLALVFGAALVGLFTWYTLDYSTYEQHGEAPVQGKVVADLAGLELSRHDGTTGPLLGPQKATLLVLYRGYW